MAPRPAKKRSAPQGRLPFEYEVDENDGAVTSYGGLPLIIDVLRSQRVDDAIRQHVHVKERACEFDEVAIIEALVLMLAAGGDCLDDIRLLSADAALCRLLDRRMPSAETLRQFLYACHDDELVRKAAHEAAEQDEKYIRTRREWAPGRAGPRGGGARADGRPHSKGNGGHHRRGCDNCGEPQT